ncbi:molybdopterin-dependent oxidoreductase [Streptomyces xanthochromogenes]|uniref:molybdopterin-dependent oxidoreductase n=1 Tax=Streptomyces xanthochromogenes TaxID=67384 RepID=UPI0037A73C1E
MERRIPVATHWGSFVAVVDSGQLVRIEPRGDDPAPSPIGPGMVAAAEDGARVLRPAVRKGWLDGLPRAGDTARGADAFVEIGWDDALTLVSDELCRVRARYGDGAVFGGSYGWASAGGFHNAQGQLQRFLALGGGYTDSRNTYSTAALEVILPHVIGGAPWSYQSRMPMWDEIAESCELVVAFGGLALKNSQINPGGLARHQTRDLQRKCRAARVRFVNVSPIRSDTADFLDAEWLPVTPSTDTALMLGMAHTMLVNDWHDQDFLTRCCVGFDRFAAYLTGDVDGVVKDADWAARITGIGRDTILDLARRLSAQRSLIMVNYGGPYRCFVLLGEGRAHRTPGRHEVLAQPGRDVFREHGVGRSPPPPADDDEVPVRGVVESPAGRHTADSARPVRVPPDRLGRVAGPTWGRSHGRISRGGSGGKPGSAGPGVRARGRRIVPRRTTRASLSISSGKSGLRPARFARGTGRGKRRGIVVRPR